jgi:hypothetical protein
MRTFLSRPPRECATVDEEGLAGADDPIVAERCQAEQRAFGERPSRPFDSAHDERRVNGCGVTLV